MTTAVTLFMTLFSPFLTSLIFWLLVPPAQSGPDRVPVVILVRDDTGSPLAGEPVEMVRTYDGLTLGVRKTDNTGRAEWLAEPFTEYQFLFPDRDVDEIQQEVLSDTGNASIGVYTSMPLTEAGDVVLEGTVIRYRVAISNNAIYIDQAASDTAPPQPFIPAENIDLLGLHGEHEDEDEPMATPVLPTIDPAGLYIDPPANNQQPAEIVVQEQGGSGWFMLVVALVAFLLVIIGLIVWLLPVLREKEIEEADNV